MTELSGFWTSDGATPEGHQVASYTQAHWSTAAAIMSACSGFEGVAPGYKNELAITYISANHCHVASGGAIVDGKWYDNDAEDLGVTIPNAAGGTIRLDRIVLRCTWADFHTEVTVLTGTAVALPDITQTSGTTYDIKLYAVSVTDAGVCTLTDERVIAGALKYRQGGSATDWNTVGTTTYIISSLLVQIGVGTATILAGNSVIVGAVTFPTAYSNNPLVLATISAKTVSEMVDIGAAITDETAAAITLRRVGTSGDNIIKFNWLAIGPP